MLSSSVFFSSVASSFLGLLNCCQFSAVVKSQQQRGREGEGEREREGEAAVPLIHLPVYYCHMSQLANLCNVPHMLQAAAATRQFVQPAKLLPCFPHTHTTWPSFSFSFQFFPFCIFHFNCLSFQLSFPLSAT